MLSFSNFLKKHWSVILLLLFFGWLFWQLLSSHMLLTKPDGLYSGGSAWGDLALHLTFVANFAQRGLAALEEYPIFLDAKFSYPFVFDLISAQLVRIGFSLRYALIIPSFIGIMAVVCLIYFLTARVTRSKIAALAAPFLFFFNGSLIAVKYFWQDFKISQLGFWDFLGRLEKQYAHLADYNLHFSNIIADYILPQRPFIFGLILGILAVYFFWQYWEENNKKYLWRAGLTISFLPIIHTHSFLTLMLVAAFLFGSQLLFYRKFIGNWLVFILPILLVALPQVLWLFPFGKEDFMRWQWGWMKQNETFIGFWLKNLSPHLFVFALAYWFARPKLKSFYLAFLGVFIITNLVIFQPYDFDNMKLMLWWFLMSVILTGELFKMITEKFAWRSAFIIAPLFISLTAVGGLSVLRESYVSWQLFSNEDIALANYVKEVTDQKTVFLTSDKHNHPIPCLAGRQIAMGYRGWLWSHGINYQEREKDILSIYSGQDNAQSLIEKYRIGYILLEKDKAAQLSINQRFFEEKYPLTWQSPNYLLFKIHH